MSRRRKPTKPPATTRDVLNAMGALQEAARLAVTIGLSEKLFADSAADLYRAAVRQADEGSDDDDAITRGHTR